MAISYLPGSQQIQRPQKPVTGELPGVGQGVREVGSSLRAFDDMLQKRIAAKAIADQAAKDEKRAQAAFELKQEADKLSIDNAKREAENVKNYQEFIGGEGRPPEGFTTQEKLDAAEQFGQIKPEQSIALARTEEEKARVMKKENLASQLIATPLLSQLREKADKEGTGEAAYNEALEILGKNGLLDTKTGEQYLSKLKTNNAYHPPLSSNLDYRQDKDANQLLLNYSNKIFDLKPLVPHLTYIDNYLVKKGVPGGIGGDVSKINIPGYGVGEKPFRNFIKSDEASNFRSRVNNIYAAWRNGLFGASLSDGEEKAFNELAANQTISSVSDLINGLKTLEDGISTQFHPVGGEAVMSFARRDQIPTYEDLPSYRRRTNTSQKNPNSPSKIEDIDNMNAEQLKAYLGAN